MNCTMCNFPARSGARVCDECGQPLEAVATAGGPSGAGAAWDQAGVTTAGVADRFARSVDVRFPGMGSRIKNILLTPKTEWPKIAAEPTSITTVFTTYVVPLAALAALISFLRFSVIGIDIPFGGTIRTPLASGLVQSVAGIGFGILGLFLYGVVINVLAAPFGGRPDLRQALKTAAYTATPVWLGSVLGLLPVFSTLLQLAAAIYAIYLLYLGLPVLMQSARERAVGYTVTVILCCVLVGGVLGVVSVFSGLGRTFAEFGGIAASAVTHERQQDEAKVGSGAVGLGAALAGVAEIGRQVAQQEVANANSRPTAAVDAMDYHVLKSLLPASLPNMQRTNAEGSSQAALGVQSSEATASYEGTSGTRAEIKIADAPAMAGLMAMAGGVAQAVSSESDAGFERNTMIDGQSAHEKYDNASKHGEITLIVGKRFVVDVAGDGVDIGALENCAAAIDLARLAALQNAGRFGN